MALSPGPGATTLSNQAHKAQAKDTPQGSFIERPLGQGRNAVGWDNARRHILNSILPSKGGSTPCGSGVMNAKKSGNNKRVEPVFPRPEMGSCAGSSSVKSGWADYRDEQFRRTANLSSSMDKTPALVVRGNGSSKREKSGLTPVGRWV